MLGKTNKVLAAIFLAGFVTACGGNDIPQQELDDAKEVYNIIVNEHEGIKNGTVDLSDVEPNAFGMPNSDSKLDSIVLGPEWSNKYHSIIPSDMVEEEQIMQSPGNNTKKLAIEMLRLIVAEETYAVQMKNNMIDPTNLDYLRGEEIYEKAKQDVDEILNNY